jgi:hypothetical protein
MDISLLHKTNNSKQDNELVQKFPFLHLLYCDTLMILKVRLTLNIIFGMCNSWMILRRNVIYLYSKKVHLNRLFHSQRSGYDVIWGIAKLISFLLFSAPKISQIISYLVALKDEKSIKKSFFTTKIYYISS